MVYGELKYFVWYMVNFGKIQWYIMKYPYNMSNLYFASNKNSVIYN